MPSENRDVVTWRPGRQGKGWAHPDGSVSWWAVNRREEPHHADMEHTDGSVRVRVSPDGSVELHDGGLSPLQASRLRERVESAVMTAAREFLRGQSYE